MQRDPNVPRIGRRNILMALTCSALVVAMPDLGRSSELRFNDFTVLDVKKKIALAGVTAARMSANNKNSVSIRVHPQFVSSKASKDEVIDFMIALTNDLKSSNFPIEGVTLVEDQALTTPFKFYPYYNGYIHPHVREGITYDTDLSANTRQIADGLELSRIAQKGN